MSDKSHLIGLPNNEKIAPNHAQRRAQRLFQKRHARKQLKQAFRNIDIQVSRLPEEELDKHLGWMAQWLDTDQKREVVRFSIKMRVRAEAKMVAKGREELMA
ncbi:MAG: hypothetical protein KAJ07_00420 [Planctomycetes bacterium]|nr:hypothetical protein [Planctomycetota bacterium]